MVQGQTSPTRIYTEPAGSNFYVDGIKYVSSATFNWPTGSRHTVWVDPEQHTGGTTRMSFSGWSDDRSLLQIGYLPTVQVTAGPEFQSLRASFSIEHRVDVLFYSLTGSPLTEEPLPCSQSSPDGNVLPVPDGVVPPPVTPTPPSAPPAQPGTPAGFIVPGPGAVFINGSCWANSQILWVAPGATLLFNTFPARGFVFEGWWVDGSQKSDSFLRSFTVDGPMVISPRFAPAKRVTIQTEPPGLQVTVDQTLTPTRFPHEIEMRNPFESFTFPVRPWDFDFAEGSTHVLGAPPSQYDLQGKTWVLDSFSIGGGEGTIYKAVGANIPESIIARFVRGTGVSIITNPPGLRLNVDGRETPSSYNFVWGVGTRHTVTAPAETTDAKGRKYKFLGWANGGPATQELTTPEESATGGLRMIANYELYPRFVISGNQAAARIQVDGALCALPCTLDRPNGTAVTVSAPEMITLFADSRLQFDSWSDGAAAARTLRFAGADGQLALRYRVFNRLTAISNPVEGATFRLDPPSADGFYPNDRTVQVRAVPAEGYKFRRWEGDLAGTNPDGALQMLTPRVVRAQIDKIPTVPTAVVRNAAGETPVAGVAPGSIISIFGPGLAAGYIAAPSGPLVQTLGNVTARAGTRILPLLFVSPEQVNAYLPSDLPDGEYSVGVRNGSMPEVAGKVNIIRNAPGIFGQFIGEQNVATAQRPNGALATIEKPAKRGEQIVLMGTGFGGYQRAVLDGFPTAENPPNPLRALPEIVAGDAVYQADFAGAAPGLVGVTMVRFTIPAEWNTGTVEIFLRQAGVESNKVLLPVE